ncbi:MAG: hypothetical protein WA116_06510 [Anaerolineaceae bacterium]
MLQEELLHDEQELELGESALPELKAFTKDGRRLTWSLEQLGQKV